MKLTLRYSISKLPSLAYDNTVASNYQVVFEPLSYLPPLPTATRVQGVLNNGRRFSHLLYSHLVHTIIISADELSDSNLSFLQNFWNADFQYLSVYDGSNWSNYKAVQTEDGAFPCEFIDGVAILPEVNLKLTEKLKA